MKKDIRRILESGCHVNYKNLSICRLKDFKLGEVFIREGYQVDCPYKPCFTEIYTDIDVAIGKFLQIKKRKK